MHHDNEQQKDEKRQICIVQRHSLHSEDAQNLPNRAYGDNKTRALAEEHGFYVVIPSKKNRKDPWEYDKELNKKRNQVDRTLFSQNQAF